LKSNLFVLLVHPPVLGFLKGLKIFVKNFGVMLIKLSKHSFSIGHV